MSSPVYLFIMMPLTCGMHTQQQQHRLHCQ
jgi:hypothetical protein